MAAGSGNSTAVVLTQLSEASANLSSDNQARTTKLMIPLVLPQLA